ncbi:MAG: hypothetical protein HY881_26785 [Deltaproteobacteria bacterium]|nr:hypothetical protein [Deltaproteobacteria bacterium]
MKDADTRKMILVLGMMAFWCNGENYATASDGSPVLRAEPVTGTNNIVEDQG